MSRGFLWLALIAFCGVFFVGLVVITIYSPPVGITLIAMLLYVVIASVVEAVWERHP